MSHRKNRKRRKKSKRIFIPETGISAKVMVDFEQIFGFRLTQKEISEKFRNADIGELLFAIARLNAIFEAGIDNRSLLNSVISRIHGNSPTLTFLKGLKEYVDQGQVPYGPHILLNIAKRILAEGDSSTWMKTRPFDDPYSISLALYLATTLSNSMNPLSHEYVLLETVQNGTFYKQIKTGAVLQRSYECYWNLASQSYRFKSSEFIDIPALYLRITGIDIRMFIKFMSSIILAYSPLLANVEEFLWSNRLAKDISVIVERFGSQEVERLLGEMSISVVEFNRDFQDTVYKRWDFSYFRKKPLVHVGELFYPLYSRFVLDYIWDGLYWRVFDGLQKHEKNKYQVFFGRIFEAYCHDLLGSIGTKIEGEIIHEFEYKQGVLSPDAFISLGTDLVVIDFKSKRLKMNDTLIKGDINSFIDDMRKMFIEPAKKIYQHLKNMSQLGDRIDPDVTTARRIHAIIVTQGAFTSIRQMYQKIDEEIRQEGLYNELPIVHWHLFDIDEFETFIGIIDNGISLVNILNQKSQSKYRYLSFSDFLAYTRVKLQFASVIQQRGKVLTNEVMGILTKNDESEK